MDRNVSYSYQTVQLTSMFLTMGKHANSTSITAAYDHAKISSVKFDEVNGLTRLDIKHNSVMDSD